MPDISTWMLFAQEAGKAAGNAPAEQAAPGLSSMLPGFALIAVFFYFIILRPQRAKDQQFRSLMDSLKDKDRVVTIGGIHGVVTNVDRQAGIVTVRIDEATGAKIRIGTTAIAKVVTDEDSDAANEIKK
jgi:preprotein translocase subunit YajC